MITAEQMKLFVYAGYAVVSLVCGILCAAYYREISKRGENAIHALLIVLVFAAVFVCWVGAVLDAGHHLASVYYRTIFLSAMMANMIFLYHFIFVITATGEKRRFPAAHYMLALTIAAAFGIWSETVPVEVRLRIIETDGSEQSGYPLFSAAYSRSPMLFALYGIAYAVPGLLRARRYRKESVNYPPDINRISLKWLYAFLFLVVLSIPIPFVTVLADTFGITAGLLFVLLSVIAFVKYIVICGSTIKGNFIFVPSFASKGETAAAVNPVLDRKKIDDYMNERKAYLNPKLRITDICEDLGTNRTYVSLFINRTYGMNFSRYINRLRLMELERLRSNPANNRKNVLELINHAGFNCYRSYLRAKRETVRSRKPGSAG